MKLVNVKQGSAEWLHARLGIPTASMYHHILTPKTMKASSQADDYLLTLLAERILGHSVNDEHGDSGFMLRGTDLQAAAISAYELARNVDVTEVGFCLHDSELTGCSPDGLVGDDGGLEMKCLSAQNHIGALLGYVDPKFTSQIQGNLWVTGRKWWDLLFYNPAFAFRIVRITPDGEYQAALGTAVMAFVQRLTESHKKYVDTYEAPNAPTKKEKKAKPEKVAKPEPWDEPVETKQEPDPFPVTKPAPAPKAAKEPDKLVDPKREFMGVLKNWVGKDGEPIVSTKSAANMRTLVSGMLGRSVTSDTMTDKDWTEVLDTFITCHPKMNEGNWKQFCENRLKAPAQMQAAALEVENDLSLDDFEPESTSKPMTVDALLKLAARHRTDERVLVAERNGKKWWVDKRSLVAAQLEVKVTDIGALDASELQALYDALNDEFKS